MTSTAPTRLWAPSGAEAGGEPRRHGAVDAAVLISVTLIAAWVRSDAMGPSSLWLDDAWVALVDRTEGWTELRYVGFSAPGFALLLRGWFGLVGFSETAAQALPFAAGVVAPALAYLVARRAGWRRAAAVIPAAILVISPIAMDYATRVKQYTLEAVLALGLLAIALHLLGDVRSSRRWVGFVGAAALATTISAFLAPYAAAGVAAGLVTALLARDRVAVQRGVIAAVGYGAFAGTWYLVVLAPAVTTAISGFWAGNYLQLTDGLAAAIDSAEVVGTGLVTGFSSAPPLVTVGALVAGAVVVAWRRPAHAVLLLTPLAVAVVLAAAQLAPLGGGRTDLYLYPSLALLLGGGVDAVVRRLPSPAGWVVPAVVVGGLALVAVPVSPYPVYDVRPLVAELEARRAPEDALLIYPATMWAYALYTSDGFALEPEASSSWGFAPRFADAATYPLPPGRDDPGAYLPTVARVQTEADRVWLLASHWREDYDALQDQLRDAGYERVELDRRDGAQLGRWERP